jgi:hypothetical protein
MYRYTSFFLTLLNLHDVESDSLDLDFARSEQNFTDPIEAFQALPQVLQESSQVVAVLSNFLPVIDAAGPGRRVFQVTLSRHHTLKAKGTETLLKQAGFVNVDGTQANTSSQKKLEFYWLVHPDRFSDWCKNPAIPCTSTNQNIITRWTQDVVQYALKLSWMGPVPRRRAAPAQQTLQNVQNPEVSFTAGSVVGPITRQQAAKLTRSPATCKRFKSK